MGCVLGSGSPLRATAPRSTESCGRATAQRAGSHNREQRTCDSARSRWRQANALTLIEYPNMLHVWPTCDAEAQQAMGDVTSHQL
jgi:hypothetical protein